MKLFQKLAGYTKKKSAKKWNSKSKNKQFYNTHHLELMFQLLAGYY